MALPVEAAQFVSSGTASISARLANSLTITQQSQRATLNWQSFNVGRNATVTFQQPDSSAVALNRIHQGSPSEIFGVLKANGEIYLINQNGILFGATARVDTHSLVASTHDVTDQIFNTVGIAAAVEQGQAAFAGAGPMGAIKLEEGAVLRSAEGGRIMVFAPRIENHGEIHTPGGQTILAASEDRVYLASSDDPDLRGLLVEVATGGSVENLGKIIAERGNVSIVGLAIAQNGVARATTAVNLNGSVRLLARDQVSVAGNGSKTMTPGRSGTLALGGNSVTEVAPDNLAQRAVDAQAQPVSRIQLMGDQVTLKAGAQVVAPAGRVEITATKLPGAPDSGDFGGRNRTDSRILIESGARIDLSGLKSAVIPMERNVISAELRGNELRDAPLQRNGVLRGQTVKVDVRQGTRLADLTGQIATIERPLDERLSSGGTVSMISQGDVVLQPGATVDVSGGSVRYRDGFIETTQLKSQGRIFDIGNADPNRIYDGIVAQPRRRFEAGYVEGKDAGTIEMNAYGLTLDGALRGGVTTGRNQRLPTGEQLTGFRRPYDQLPLGGELILGRAGVSTISGLTDFTLGSLAEIGAEGMSRVRIHARDSISVPENARVELGPQGELTLDAKHVTVGGDIFAPGGTVELGQDEQDSTFTLSEGAHIDVAGRWVNDGAALNPGGAPATPFVLDGGSVTLRAGESLVLAAGSEIDADGGAWMQRDGKLKFGSGGDIALFARRDTPSQVAPELRLEGDVHAYAFRDGGTIRITAGGFEIGGGPDNSPTRTIYLAPAFFQSGGFRRYDLIATHDGITLVEGTALTPGARNRALAAGYINKATGTALDRIGFIATLPDYQRQPVSLALTFARDKGVVDTTPRVEIQTGAAIVAEPGASVALQSDTQLVVDGTIEAPGGAIDLRLVQPDSDNERGFDRTQTIWLGEHGQLLAPAVFKPVPDKSSRRLRLGTMLDGGSVNVSAQRGYFLALPGSKIDVSGATRDMDVQLGPIYTPAAVNGAAGSISLLAAEGMVLNGELRGVRGSASGAAGGSLSIALDHSERGSVQPDFEQLPVGPREVTVSAIGVDAPAIGTAVPDELNGKVRVDPAKITDGGFDTLTLRAKSASTDFSDAAIKLEGNVALTPAQSLVLDAPVLASDGGNAALSAAYVRLGTSRGFFGIPADAQSGTGSVRITGQHVDLHGTLALRGFGAGGATTGAAPVRIESAGDIRFVGGDEVTARDDGIYSIGHLNSAADVTLQADQVYAATATDFTLSVAGDDGKVTIESGGNAQAPLSAGSRIAIAAAHIEQRGTLRAPFGQIELNAGKSLLLADGSLTSVSGDGQLVPFGTTEFGADWLYRMAGSARVYESAPVKRIITSAPDINIAPGSVVDVSGGGDLLAREHLPGPGGSRDILDSSVAGDAFAILPAHNNLFGYYDPQLTGKSLDGVGRTVHLAGSGDIAAGEYAVLPAGYALLPGAYLVTPVATDAPVPGQAATLANGAAIVAGQRGVAGTDTRDSLWSAYLIEDGAQVRNRAEYLESRADDFLANGNGPLNRDAGTLVIDAGTKLALGGRLANNAAAGRGSEVDIIADRLAVVTQQTGTTGLVEIVAGELNALNADSLLLGARRTQQDASLVLDVRAAEVSVQSGAAVAAPEVMLAARDKITIAGDATITAADGGRVRAPETIVLAGDSAFARVSAGEQVAVERSASPGTAGTLEVAAGARLSGSRSITLDASKDVVVDGDLVTDNGSLNLGAARISLGETEGVTGGLVLSNEDLARLNARDLILGSRSTVDVYGAVMLDVEHLALDAAGLAGYRNAGKQVSLSADTIELSNRAGANFAGAPDGNASLTIAAREATLGEGEFAVRGFGATRIAGSERIAARPRIDKPVALHVAGDLTLETPSLTATSGADVSIDTSDAAGAIVGQVHLAAPAQVAPQAAAAPLTGLGAKLEIKGTTVALDTHIEVPSGIVALHATGAGGVSLGAGASVDAAGRDFVFDDLTVSSPGGQVALLADQGGVNIASGARIDVSGGSAGGDAGKLSVSTPQGAFALDPGARLAAAAAAGARAGSFVLDAGSLPGGFSALNTALNSAGFTATRNLRLRTGDIAIGADDLVRAQDFRLAADAGQIDVYGRIDASGEQAGDVALFAGGDLTVHGSARIDAHATGAGEKGGTVVLASRDGRLTLAETDDATAAGIDVSGTREDGSKDDSGTAHLRARRDTDTSVAVEDRIATNIAGARSIEVEAVKAYAAQTIDDALIGTIKNETDTFMTNSATIETALGKDADARIHLVPGVEVRSDGDLNVGADWDLLDWRYDGQAGVLTLRAAGDLNLNHSVSDGVRPVSFTSDLPTPRDVVQTGPSWSYRLAAGADLASADPLATVKRTDKGDLMLASGAKLRTGTGDIEIATGRDLKLADSTAAIYTAGENRGPGAIPGTGDYGPDVTQQLLYAADFLHHGGDIHIDVARNVQGANGGQFVNEWLARVGNTSNGLPTGDNVDLGASWAVAVGNFQQNIGALGGGDVTIEAGGGLSDLSVVIPTTAQPTGGVGTAPLVAGGGDMRIEAGGDILGGSYYLARGKAHIASGGSFAATDSESALPMLALGDGQYAITARKDLGIDAVVNPTVLPMNPMQGTPEYPKLARDAFFFTYGPDSAAQLTSIAGDVLLRADTTAMGNTFDSVQALSNADSLGYYPGSLRVRSLQGDVLINKSLTLTPSARGDLELLAQNSIRAGDVNTTVSLSDADPALLPGTLNPVLGIGEQETPVSRILATHAPIGLHKGDPKPARIVAQTGGIGSLPDSANQLSLQLAKQAHVIAGGDIVNLGLAVQHVDARDISVVQAGGDIVFPTPRSGDGSVNASEGKSRSFRFAGPGEVHILAGRDVDLGAAGGIVSIGNMDNPALPDGGASITVMAGQRTPPAYDAFIERYLAAGSGYGEELAAYMRKLESADESVEAFRALPLVQQRTLILEILFSELREAGKLAATTGQKEDYERGYEAIRTLFPGDSYPGDLKSFLSQIYTRDGGDINLIVPGGLVNAGVASATAVKKEANELGIVAERDGNINAMAYGDFLVNQSRVFALDGGGIVIWSSTGDIDAGRGAKTALAVPAAVATTDAFGKTIVEFPPAISGSGIKASVRTLGREPGDVFLIAPIGIVDAGDAGIEAAGNLTIAATAVLGASNIKVGGVSTGVPLADSGASAVSASVGAAAAAAAKSGEEGSTTKRAVMDKEGNISIIEVEVIGFGDEGSDGDKKKGCGPEDKDCQKG